MDRDHNTTIMKYLLDTVWIINLLAGKQDEEEHIQRFEPEEIVISVATVAEVYKEPDTYTDPQARLQAFRQF